ncbi:MAG: hypothetical protein KJZ53_03870, partial [Anaerolineales bacterium]|nr:hypothetical protein [Anaerolineales bacterium]
SGTPDLAVIEGNASSRYFGVFSYGNDIDLLVNTTDPYSGTQIIDRSAIVIEVVADGAWSISISAP